MENKIFVVLLLVLFLVLHKVEFFYKIDFFYLRTIIYQYFIIYLVSYFTWNHSSKRKRNNQAYTLTILIGLIFRIISIKF